MRLFLFLFCHAITLSLFAHNPAVVIVGGGPAGLATAIEAHASGADVWIIEKRNEYTRQQTVFLTEATLQLLEKWGVDCAPINVIDTGEGGRSGVVGLRVLEGQLEARCQALGITKIEDECVGVHPEMRYVETPLCNLPYDILVVADGCHSKTREALGIQIKRYGQASAVAAFVSTPHEKMEISDAIQKGEVFVKRIMLPHGSLLFAQSVTEKKIPLAEVALACGWSEESLCLQAGKAVTRDGIEVVLQQAVTFSDPEKGVILVGDAAACASFLDGMGANAAFRGAACAGAFFGNRQERGAYESFNSAMQNITDELIAGSRYLFN